MTTERSVGQTPQQKRAIEFFTPLFGEGSEWRAGVLVLTYRRPDAGERDVSMTHVIAMQGAESALDIVLLEQRLRTLADELAAFILNPRSTHVGFECVPKSGEAGTVSGDSPESSNIEVVGAEEVP